MTQQIGFHSHSGQIKRRTHLQHWHLRLNKIHFSSDRKVSQCAPLTMTHQKGFHSRAIINSDQMQRIKCAGSDQAYVANLSGVEPPGVHVFIFLWKFSKRVILKFIDEESNFQMPRIILQCKLKVWWVPPVNLHTSCALDWTYWPWDRQVFK